MRLATLGAWVAPVLVGAACALSCGVRDDEGASHEPLTRVCPAAVVEGIDVSSYQGEVAFDAVASAGRGFAFVKATQGTYHVQSTLAATWQHARAAGVLRGAYHFFDPTEDGVTQANAFLAAVDAAGGMVPGDLPPMLDLECPTAAKESAAAANCLYAGASGWVPLAALRARVFDWMRVVEAAVGRKPIVYSYASWFDAVGFTDAALRGHPLFVASIASCPSVPAPWSAPTFWQYSFAGTVPGVRGDVDLDRFVGTPAQLRLLTLPVPNAPSNDGADAGDAGAASTPAYDAGTSSSATSPPPTMAAPSAVVPAADGNLEGGGDGCNVHSNSGAPSERSTAFALLMAISLAVGSIARRRHRVSCSHEAGTIVAKHRARFDAGSRSRVRHAPRP